MKWPKSVDVVESGQVGTETFFRREPANWLAPPQNDSIPCCAVGHAAAEFHLAPLGIPMRFHVAYERCAAADNERNRHDHVTDINDRSPPDKRALYYNAAWAALGYVVGQDPAAIKLARKAGYKV